MHTPLRRIVFAAFTVLFSLSVPSLWAQSAGNSGTIYGSVADATGAIVSDASVSVQNPVSGYVGNATTDSAGRYQFTNLPFNPYHLVISTKGFATYTCDVDVRSVVPVVLKTTLTVR
jgi:hypothetical protein